MRKLLAALLLAMPAFAQVGPPAGAKPGTCPGGQFMYKTSATALPTCAVPGAGGSVLTTKGDVLGFSNTAARIPVGANGTVLMADSTNALGVSYQTVGSSVSCFSSGVGSPEGVVTAVTGCTYVNTSNSDIYTKAYGSGNTGWVLTTAPGFLYGAGSPEGAQVGYIGDLYLRTSDLHWWQKQTGDGTDTGWVDLGTTPPSGGGRKITGVGTPNRLAYWTGASTLGFTTATWNNSTGTMTATTFNGDHAGTINTATTATTQSANDNSTKVATTAYVDTLGTATILGTNPGGRLTLTTGVPITDDDVLTGTTLYYTPYRNTQISLYYSGAWRTYTLSEQSLKATDSSQTGTMTSGTAVITGLTSTVGLVVGMEITGTSVGVGSVIVSVDSLTQVTGSVNSTGSTTNGVTFKLPANTLYDVVAVPTSTSAFRIQFLSAWTNSGAGTSARAIGITFANAQDGVLVNDSVYASGQYNTIAAKGGRYLGTIRTNATAGQLQDDNTGRLVANYYNSVRRGILVVPGYSDNNSVTTWTTTSTSWTPANGGTGAVAGYISLGPGQPQVDITAQIISYTSVGAGNAGYVGIGDNNSAWSGVVGFSNHYAATTQSQATVRFFYQVTTLGYNTLTLLVATSAGTETFDADLGRALGGAKDSYATYMSGTVNG